MVELKNCFGRLLRRLLSLGLLRQLLQLSLFLWFVTVVGNSVRKLNSDKGTLISYRHGELTLLPALTICHVPISPSKTFLLAHPDDHPDDVLFNSPAGTTFQEELDRSERENIRSPFLLTVYFSQDSLRSTVETDNVSWIDLLDESSHSHLDYSLTPAYLTWGDYRALFRCTRLTLREPVSASPTGLLTIFFAVEPGMALWMKLHEIGEFFQLNDRYLGAEYVVRAMNDPGRLSVVAIRKKVVWRVDEGGAAGCDDDDGEGRTSFSSCADAYFSRQIGCRLPWVDEEGGAEDLRSCSTSADLDAFYNVSARFGRDFATEDAAKRETGCRSKCKYVKYSAEEFADVKSLERFANATGVSFSVMDSNYREEREFYRYNLDKFVANFGCYLGLLLGLSLLDVYQWTIGVVGKLEKKLR